MAQIFVKLLDGRTQCLQISTPTISGLSLKQDLHKSTRIPLQFIRLISGTREISEETLISASSDDAIFPSLTLLLRLRGGKGGFGSLLRGAATKAGQKKKNNFDACRDMSGRRLRHVNAEKKLEEWKAEAGERKLEKIAEDFLKKKAKEAKKNKSGDDKYLQKYMEDSAQCVERVETSVRETFQHYMNSKRKVFPGLGPASKSKRVKFWTENDSDTDEDEQSVVLNNEKTDEGTSGSSFARLTDGEFSGGSSSKGISTEINGICNEKGLVMEGCGNGVIDTGDDSSVQPKHEVCNGGLELEDCSVGVALNPSVEVELGMPHHDSEEMVEGTEPDASMNVGSPVEPKLKICEETVASVTCLNGLLNFDEFNSAAELEVLGMERLKVELQSHGLKCGGTLQDRAARLFLLKSTPFDKLPKKLLAKTPMVKSN